MPDKDSEDNLLHISPSIINTIHFYTKDILSYESYVPNILGTSNKKTKDG